jgi:hypothetical protein
MLISNLCTLYCADTINWSDPATIAGSQGALNVAIARDAHGNALVAWLANTGNSKVIRTSYYNASYKSWSSIKELGSAYFKSYLYVSMNKEGDGIIAWIDADQIVTTVTYAQEDWQTWQPSLVKLSDPSDKATDLYMPQTLHDNSYLAWISSSGVHAVSYTRTSNSWSTPKTLAYGHCTTLYGATDAIGNASFTWITITDSRQTKVCATRYDTMQSWDSWTPYVHVLSQDNSLCPGVAMSSPSNTPGTTIFIWLDAQGLHAASYSPEIPWQTWNPSNTKKLITNASLPYAQVAMDKFGNGLFVWQSYTGYCQVAQYSSSQPWQSWDPTGKVIVEDKTIMNDIALEASQQGLILLTSLENYRLNTLYVALTDSQGHVDAPLSITRTCIPSTQKMLALKQDSSAFDAMVVWPSVTSKGIRYLVSE